MLSGTPCALFGKMRTLYIFIIDNFCKGPFMEELPKEWTARMATLPGYLDILNPERVENVGLRPLYTYISMGPIVYKFTIPMGTRHVVKCYLPIHTALDINNIHTYKPSRKHNHEY